MIYQLIQITVAAKLIFYGNLTNVLCHCDLEHVVLSNGQSCFSIRIAQVDMIKIDWMHLQFPIDNLIDIMVTCMGKSTADW